MGRKCCVTGCRLNYDPTDKMSGFRLLTDKDEREHRMKATLTTIYLIVKIMLFVPNIFQMDLKLFLSKED